MHLVDDIHAHFDRAGRINCVVTQNADGTVHISFDEPQRAIARGQAVVLYDGDTVVGGGTIL